VSRSRCLVATVGEPITAKRSIQCNAAFQDRTPQLDRIRPSDQTDVSGYLDVVPGLLQQVGKEMSDTVVVVRVLMCSIVNLLAPLISRTPKGATKLP
jgi:hypothetical protein